MVESGFKEVEMENVGMNYKLYNQYKSLSYQYELLEN